ncbi:bridge-like lipid transfer protein family member 3B [Diabrotica undecimpunctata]|uniref:bridge-like lipid transfer protein family member 3B n=1 Tax=Diabrotica undecimpunctata TaxID=50387 RepID=UPI003B63647E
MVSIIKNQLLKHLSRFTKNLSADKINLSTFKGEGELSNLELNEVVLMDLLELPSWLCLKQAWCNKVTFRIPWTKLKSVPICLNLEEVEIVVETCADLRIPPMQQGNSNAGVPGKYSFIHKVIDGITVHVNTVNILFTSPAFSASVQISRIVVDSKNHKFQPSDLRMTRLKNQAKGQVLIFKELKWDTVRIEAKSTKDKNLTPLRLIINEARCRIVIKKRLSDSFILGSRLAIILNDLMWFFTDSQLKAALYFIDSLTDLIQKSTQITRRTKAARKLEELPEYQAQLSQEESEVVDKYKLFAAHDVIETSYHLISHQIMLHLSDDEGAGRSSHPNLKNGDALHISLKKFHVDYYPYHLAKGNRKHWLKYNTSFVPHSLWQEQALNSFKTKLLNLIDQHKPLHTPLNRPMKNPDSTPQSPESKPQPNSDPRNKKKIEAKIAKLMTSCIVLRIEDFTIYKVSSSQKKGLKEFIFGDRTQLSLPVDSNMVHAEFTYYYYPSDVPFPLPPPKFYVQLNPISVMFDVDTCLWINSFGLNLFQSLASAKSEVPVSTYTYMDIKIEAILPRINFESPLEHPNQKDRPKCLSFQVTRATITNIRSLEQSSRADLAKCVDSFHMGSLFFGSEFPSQQNDFYVVTQKFIDHISTVDNIRNMPSQIDSSISDDWMANFSREMLWTDAKDVWCINLDPVWADFNGARAIGIAKSVPFLDALPVTIWLHTHMDPNSTVKPTGDCQENSQADADIHALVYITNLVSIQINHYQYLFLLRLAEDAALLATYLAIDAERILKVESNSTIAMGVLIPQLEVTFVMPSNSPGKESSGGDIESVVPDTSSLADDIFIGSNPSVWQNSSLSITQIGVSKKPIANGSSNQLDLRTSNSSDYLQTSPNRISHEDHSFLLQQKGNLNLQTNLNMGFTSLKKGFTSLKSSIDSALKASPDDLSDTMSIRSDASSDSEKFVHINCDLDIAGAEIIFIVVEFSERVEEASEVLEEDNTVTSTSEHSVTSTSRRKDLVSVSTFKLNKIEFVYQSLGFQSSLKIQLTNLVCDDCSCISWDELQSKFGTRSRVWTCNPPSDFTSPKVKLRLDHNLVVSKASVSETDLTNRDSFAKLFSDLITIQVKDLMLNLNMSTVTGLADLVEDEVMPTPFPIKMTVDNVKVHLNEDRPPVNITSPGPIPIDLNVTHMYITRTEDGVFNLFPCSKSKTNSTNGQSAKKELVKVDSVSLNNDDLRRLMTFERISEENRLLRKTKEESDKEKDVLREYLKKSQDEVTRLLNEKQNLLDEIRRLQHHWNSSKR